jgi:hypothetical protein
MEGGRMDGEMLESAVKLSVVLGFIGGVFSYVVLRPLNSTMTELRVAVQELRKDLKDSEERRHKIEIKLAEVDQRAKVAHSRIDELVKFCQRNHEHGDLLFKRPRFERGVNEDEELGH